MSASRLTRRVLMVLVIAPPWMLLLVQSYLAYKFPIKMDRYGHPYSRHAWNRAVAFVHLFRSPFRAPNARMDVGAINQIIADTSAKYLVDACLIESIVAYESGFNPNTITTTGAMGLMALMPRTASKLHVQDPFDPLSNIDAGTRLLQELLRAFNGDVNLTLAGYNAGQGAVRKSKGVPRIRETSDYVAHVGHIYHLCTLHSASNVALASMGHQSGAYPRSLQKRP